MGERLPALPGKHYNLFRNSSVSSKVISERKALLDKYLRDLLRVKAVATSKTLLRWLDPEINVRLFTSLCISFCSLFRSLIQDSSLSCILQPGQFSFAHPDKTGYLSKEGHVVRNWKKVKIL